MATYGFLARTSSGDVLIDGEHPHTFLAYSTKVNLPPGKSNERDGNLVAVFPQFPPTTLPPTVVYRSDDGWFCQAGVDTNVNGQYYRSVIFVPMEVPAATMEMAVFVPYDGIKDQTNYGIQVFSSDGSLVFDSRMRTLVVHETGTHQVVANGFQGWQPEYYPVTFQNPTPKKPWIFMDMSFYRITRWLSGGGFTDENWIRMPFIGPLTKNAQGEYTGFQFAVRPLAYFGRGYFPDGPGTWNMQWVAFV